MHEKQLDKILVESKHSLLPTVIIPNPTVVKVICKKFTHSSHMNQSEKFAENSMNLKEKLG